MITSTGNERIKLVRALQAQGRARRKAGLFVIEGITLVRDAMESGASIKEIFYTSQASSSKEGMEVLDQLSHTGASLLLVDDEVMRVMSDTQTPQGILVVLSLPRLELPEEPTFTLIIDSVSDPGNMGTIMRSAAAAGVPVIFTTAGTVDITNPKVVRSAMGAHFRLPVQPLSWEGIVSRMENHVIFIAESGGGSPYYCVDWTQPCALIVSDEAHGPSHEALRTAHARVTIPMPGKMESLNVAVATGILIYEMVRQRSQLSV